MVDGKQVDTGRDRLYMDSDSMEIMMPVSMVTKAFSCAENYYDNSRLVLEKNAFRVELEESVADRGGRLYIPLRDIEEGLGYTMDWDIGANTVTMTNKNPDMRTLPYAYDYRKEGRVPAVKNQGSLGTCWSFASLTALETVLMPEEPLDFSEDHMSINNSFHLTQNDGGEYTMSMAYLLAWQGPVLEEDDPYGDGKSPDDLEPVKHVQEIQILPSKDYEKIKEAVYLYGGVQSSLYTSLKNYKSRSVYYNQENNAYCYIGPEKPNHDSVIIGWDDNYPKENFNMDLEGDGAFICVNSWGQEFGDEGYFYVSYYDTNIGIHNILYTRVEDTDNYDHIYQTDLCGWIGQLGYGEETAYFANVYKAGDGENLRAAGFYATGADTDYEVYVARNLDESRDFSKRALAAKGNFANSGYYTVDFDRDIELEDGEEYAVIVKITTPGSVHPVAIEYDAEDNKAQVDITDGEGYISLKGTVWERSEEKQSCNLCLKAYTVDRE
ncbi:hypothetical protein GPL15_05030 [Clostridium sp. MCC353]|nr:hypothetical protein [Clostridium sp. MCC353]